MYTLPEDFDFQLLSGCYLEMVCFGPRITKLDFSRAQMSLGERPYKVSFCVEAGLLYEIGGVLGSREFSASSTSAPLLNLLLKDVATVSQIGPASLQILFSSNEQITIEADCDSEYESYSIYLDSGEVIVV